jgi:hypothetical protein
MGEPFPLTTYRVVDKGDSTFAIEATRDGVTRQIRHFWTIEDAEAWVARETRRPRR